MLEFSNEKIDLFKDFIENHDFFYIIGHKEPDGDCVSSCLGIARIIEKFNKKYKLLSAGPFKKVEIKKFEPLFSTDMDFLSEQELKKTGPIICDCSEISRLGDINGDFSGFDTFIIDHHKTSSDTASPSIIDSLSPAASLIVQILYEKLIGKVDQKLAEILFFGTMTDTGFFRFLNETSANALKAITRLIEAGANPRKTYDEMTSGKSFDSRKLLALHLNHAEKYLNGKLIITHEKMEETKKFAQEGRDSDSLYQALLSIENVEAVVFIREDTESTCTAGFRSKDDVDVSKIAAKFGGGGHKNASGLSCQGRIETLIPKIVEEFSKVM